MLFIVLQHLQKCSMIIEVSTTTVNGRPLDKCLHHCDKRRPFSLHIGRQQTQYTSIWYRSIHFLVSLYSISYIKFAILHIMLRSHLPCSTTACKYRLIRTGRTDYLLCLPSRYMQHWKIMKIRYFFFLRSSIFYPILKDRIIRQLIFVNSMS